MSPTIQSLGIDQLSKDEKLHLISEIWDSISPADRATIPDWQRELLEQRLAEADANPGTSRPWEEVKARLLEGR